MKTHLKKMHLQTTTLFKFAQKKIRQGQQPWDPTLTITVTGETILAVVPAKG
ncbi:hypothetical protein [Pontibacter sp. SGAir0037]|uniref:hypothetical protein n=1 Tax=Pontibacter sp. SGAir0037 TaxID=2571030 RepID=UPI00143DC59B|nr:hypothetical protein [Pontibacter sp. SGAir0037]